MAAHPSRRASQSARTPATAGHSRRARRAYQPTRTPTAVYPGRRAPWSSTSRDPVIATAAHPYRGLRRGCPEDFCRITAAHHTAARRGTWGMRDVPRHQVTDGAQGTAPSGNAKQHRILSRQAQTNQAQPSNGRASFRQSQAQPLGNKTATSNPPPAPPTPVILRSHQAPDPIPMQRPSPPARPLGNKKAEPNQLALSPVPLFGRRRKSAAFSRGRRHLRSLGYDGGHM